MWAVVAVATGAALGLVSSGRGRRPGRVRWWGLIPAGLALRAVVEVIDLPAGVAVLMASYALLLAAAVLNLNWRGSSLVALGLALCALVVSLDGGTPVSRDALATAGRYDLLASGPALPGERHIEQDRDRLVILGDVLPVPLTRHVTSFGELLALVGLGDVAFNVTARRPARRRRPGDADGDDVAGDADGDDVAGDPTDATEALVSSDAGSRRAP